MPFQLELSKPAIKALESLPVEMHVKVTIAMTEILVEPYSGKKLRGEHKGKYAYRVWPFRIMYEICKDQLLVLVIDIAHRKDVYR